MKTFLVCCLGLFWGLWMDCFLLWHLVFSASFLSSLNCPAATLIVAFHIVLCLPLCSHTEWSIPSCDICHFNWSLKHFLDVFLASARPRGWPWASWNHPCGDMACPSKLPQHRHSFYALDVGMLEHLYSCQCISMMQQRHLWWNRSSSHLLPVKNPVS